MAAPENRESYFSSSQGVEGRETYIGGKGQEILPFVES